MTTAARATKLGNTSLPRNRHSLVVLSTRLFRCFRMCIFSSSLLAIRISDGSFKVQPAHCQKKNGFDQDSRHSKAGAVRRPDACEADRAHCVRALTHCRRNGRREDFACWWSITELVPRRRRKAFSSLYQITAPSTRY